MKNRLPEILAPAGSMEALTAALRTGADAVYVGGKKFSARSSAANFSPEELREAADKCHLYGAKLYLAVNTIVSDDEIEEFHDYIKLAAECGIDAYIVQDSGCAYIIKKSIPNAVLHASTQMTIHTAYGALLAEKLGFCRVVPARELDCNTLKKICDTGIETEIFVHGALCMSVSGQCYMSAMIGSRSANRGCCGQACRLPFSACGNSDAAALSLKDLSLIPIISRLEEIGADSLKIEGRMKRPEYVAASVSAIRNAFDGKQPDMQLLRKIFSRGGFTNGYFTSVRKDMFGVREKSDVISAQTIIPQLHELYRSERKTRIIDFHAVIKADLPFQITAYCDGLSVSAISERPEAARNAPTDLHILEKQLSRLGDTVYLLGKVTADIDDGLIVPAGRINELGRTLTDKMNKLIVSVMRPKYEITDYQPKITADPPDTEYRRLPLRTFCLTVEQATAAYPLSEYIIVPHELLSSDRFENMDKQRIIVSPPRFIVDENTAADSLKSLFADGYRHLLCHNTDCISIGIEIGFTLHGGFGLNVYNSFSAKVLSELGLDDITVSFEAKASQINRIRSDIPVGAVIYGRLPLMLTRNCPIKNEIGCVKCRKQITDRTGHSFPVSCSKDYAEILNSDILYMFDKLNQFSSLSFGTILLSEENAEQTVSALKGTKPSEIITRGLYFRGI